MALINCPECGKEMVSDSAESCPSCGFKIKKYFDQQNINQHTERIPKLYNDDDINMYKLVITDFYDTDTAALAGLDDVLNIDLSYDEAMSLFKYESYIISKYDSEEESILALKKLEKWGINAYIINPDGCINPYRVNVLESKNTNFSYNYASEKLKVDRTMAILCFLVPIIGIIIYCINVSTSPIQSKRCLTISIYGIVIGTIITLLLS